jgi:ribosome-associated translation inhibitor RaiA
MRVQLSGHHVVLTAALRSYVEKKQRHEADRRVRRYEERLRDRHVVEAQKHGLMTVQ